MYLQAARANLTLRSLSSFTASGVSPCPRYGEQTKIFFLLINVFSLLCRTGLQSESIPTELFYSRSRCHSCTGMCFSYPSHFLICADHFLHRFIRSRILDSTIVVKVELFFPPDSPAHLSLHFPVPHSLRPLSALPCFTPTFRSL